MASACDKVLFISIANLLNPFNLLLEWVIAKVTQGESPPFSLELFDPKAIQLKSVYRIFPSLTHNERQPMQIHLDSTKTDMGSHAASGAAQFLRQALASRGAANLILATGASQFEMLSALVQQDVDWSKVTVFHLDEYIGLPITHPAGFRKYLQERFEQRVPRLAAFHYVNGEAPHPQAECERLNAIISRHPIDVACIGIGENGHLAFNDPPADFATESPYIVVNLDEACRRQQLGEGWFPTLADVPRQAISMSIHQIMKSATIICTVPDARKAVAVQKAVEGPVTNLLPASILQHHLQCWLYLDEPAAALLVPKMQKNP
jgi:glucosamine-6-phosphate deaminase